MKIVCEERCDEGLRFFKDGCCGTIRTIDGGGDKRVIEINQVGNIYEDNGWNSEEGRVYGTDGMMPCMKAHGGNKAPMVFIKQATTDGYIECKLGGVADLSYPTSKTRRGRVQDGGDTCPTLTATETGVCRIETPYRIRKLTPLECWRLMDFTDEDFHKAEVVNSNTQLYKQAGNSIVKAVLMAIFKQMLGGTQ